MRKIAIIIFGPPGSGKGTQANLTASKLGLIHFDTGQFLESVVHDPARKKNPLIAREKKFFDTGILLTPSFVCREVSGHIRKIADAGWGVVLSASPRTLAESKQFLPFLEKLFGKKNIFFFVLDVPERVSIARNSSRLVCRFCKAPLLTQFYPAKKPTRCPVCGGKLYRRSLDNVATINVRLKEYEARTEPVFAFIMKRGYRVVPIDGRAEPYKVFQKIRAKLIKPLGKSVGRW